MARRDLLVLYVSMVYHFSVSVMMENVSERTPKLVNYFKGVLPKELVEEFFTEFEGQLCPRAEKFTAVSSVFLDPVIALPSQLLL